MPPVVQTLITDHSAMIGLVILVFVFITFAMERRPPVVIAVLGGIAMMLLGFLPVSEALGVFANPAPITIAAMFILSGALLRTGALEEISGWVIRRTLRRPRLAVAEIGGGTMLASAFMNNTPVVIVMIPIVQRLARVMGIAATRLLMPLSFISILGGTLTLIGTSTNLLVDGVAQTQGMEPFGIFEMTAVGLVSAMTGVILLGVLGRVLLPDRAAHGLDAQSESDVYLSHLVLLAKSNLIGRELGSTAILRRPGIRSKGWHLRV